MLSQLNPYLPGKSISGGMKLSSNENPLGSSPHAMAAIRDAVSENAAAPADLNRYPDGGMHLLKDRLAAFWDVTPEMLLVGNGSDEILVMIAGAFIEPGRNAITGRHTFSQYTFATTIFGGTMRYADMPDGGFDLPGIAGLIDADTRLVFLCNPNNPSATAFNHQALVSFLQDVPDHVVVVIDEAYGEFAEATDFPRTMELIREHPNLVRLRTFSKVYGLAGLRVGYATAQASLIGPISRLRQPFNVGTVAQVATAAALDDREFVEKSIRNNRAGRDRIITALDQLGVAHFPSEANFLCIHLPTAAGTGSRATTVVGQLADRGIAVRALGSFGLPEHIRISVGTPDEVTALCEALALSVRSSADLAESS
jgi:histidinol-phosphate aminotransferase